MPKVTNRTNRRSWIVTEKEAQQIENSELRNLYIIERTTEPAEVTEMRKKHAQVKLPEVNEKAVEEKAAVSTERPKRRNQISNS